MSVYSISDSENISSRTSSLSQIQNLRQQWVQLLLNHLQVGIYMDLNYYDTFSFVIFALECIALYFPLRLGF